MRPWFLHPLLSIDTETTGINPFVDRVVEVAAVEVLPNSTIDAASSWSAIIDPGVEIPVGASAIHGITTARAQSEGSDPAAVLTLLAERIYAHAEKYGPSNAAIVMYNARFDWPLLLCEAERHGVDIPPFAAILDPMLIDRMVDRYRKGGRKLLQVAAHYGVEFAEEDAHGALADAVASGLVMRAICDRYPRIVDHSLATLWVKQVHGHERWVSFLREKVDPDVVSGWPIPVATP